MDQTAQSNTPPQIFPADQVSDFFVELGLQNLPEDRKAQMLNQMIDTVLGRIFLRIEPSLTETDRQVLSEMEGKPNGDAEIFGYLQSVLPNLNQIAQEEVQNYKEELKVQVSTIVDLLDKESENLRKNNIDQSTQNTQMSQPNENPNPNDSSNSEPA